MGRAGWLWLTRPEGWALELADLETTAAARAADLVEQREERAATRKLAAAQAAALRAATEASERLAELDDLRVQLAHEHAARATAEARAVELEGMVVDLTAARADVVRNLKDVESRLVDRATEVNAVKARIRALEAEARARGDVTPADAVDARDVSADEPPATAGLGFDPADVADVATEVARAARGAAGLADALAALARLLGDDDPALRATVTGAGLTAGDAGNPIAAADATGLAVEPGPPRARRLPVALPGGMFDDTVEAAEHLLRTPGAVLVVDGYNVTMEGWPELRAADQRRRLVVALSDLAARTATQVELVFDGAEVEPLSVPTPARQLVRVRFSDPGVEADDVVIDLVASIPAATPVIVASSDNRVRDGSRRRGANLLHARQLVAALRR